MGKQDLAKNGQPIYDGKQKCPHGVFQDARGNSACEDCFEHRATSSYLLGIAVGHEQIAGWLKKRAGDAFSEGRDAEAASLRALSAEVLVDAKKCRAEQERHDHV